MAAHPLDNPIWFALTTEQRSFARGVQPFLHVGSANARAQALYTRLGFRSRAELRLWHVRRDQ